LKLKLTPAQKEVFRLIHKSPYRVLVKAGHSVGKTCLLAAAVNYYYDCFDPSWSITTAPTAREVEDLLWSEVRTQRRNAGLPDTFIGETSPEMRTDPEHFAKGFTAAKDVSFQGRHRDYQLFGFDEAVGVKAPFWKVTNTMFKPNGRHVWIAIFNPTDPASQAYAEENARRLDGSPKWHVVTMSALDHPNIEAELAGKKPPIPSAVTLDQVNDWVADWCDPLPPGEDKQAGDFLWPRNKSGRWYRPGPLFQCRALGAWPSQGVYGVWSDYLWQIACQEKPFVPPLGVLPEIGWDIATFGDDWSAFHVRWSGHSVHHERHSGWTVVQGVARCRQLANEWCAKANAIKDRSAQPWSPKRLPIKYDGDGIGCGVPGLEEGYNFIPVCASSAPFASGDYAERRTELWFNGQQLCNDGEMNLSRLTHDMREILKGQAMAPVWKVNAAGKCQLERKAETKKRTAGVSPDDMDALNLAYARALVLEPPSTMPDPPRPPKSDPGFRFKQPAEREHTRRMYGRDR
jgi:hypothetical protein